MASYGALQRAKLPMQPSRFQVLLERVVLKKVTHHGLVSHHILATNVLEEAECRRLTSNSPWCVTAEGYSMRDYPSLSLGNFHFTPVNLDLAATPAILIRAFQQHV